MYNKLFTKILDSSIWLEAIPTRLVWLTFLAVMDEAGFVQFASVPNAALRARVPLAAAEKAIACLEAPDPLSADPENEGRRIEKVPGGWMVLNAEKYRDLVTRANSQAQTRARVAKHREKKRNAPVTVDSVTSENGNAHVTPSEAYTEARSESGSEEEQRIERASPPLFSARSLMEQWNALTSAPIPQCKGLSEKRKTAALARLRDLPSRDEWVSVIARIQASPFCRGENERGWVASFDWLIQRDTALKVSEGKYDYRPSVVSTKSSRTIAAGLSLDAKLAAGAEIDPFGTNAYHESQRKLKAGA